MKQLDHYNTNFKSRQFPITLICEQVANAPNIGSLFRTADAFGIEKLIFCGEHIPLGRKMTKTSRSTEKVVDFEIIRDASTHVKVLKNEGHLVIGLEITNNSQAINSISFTNKKSIVLIVGGENFGVSKETLQLCDVIMHINMFGQNSSMNVVQATTIALYEMTKQML
ncbi:TrmH family RNA methyltransferase [Ichthyenterobacterium magnum]|uniref:SpoU rRNA methylase family protein n=1 Tax=Ichthyenterobacterium magnum TaxID=1230530 RepID=A0A420DML2_9FLAO|nr:TrmH family RNA methyltransferase [Ichthyenterobacterium magnum]RKE95440.1 SpoU rRNA methylase family protein [Ichthyenterobacterium magnum]